MPCRLAVVVLLGLVVAVDARAVSFVMPLAADSPRPTMVYSIRADDGASTAFNVVRVEADSGFAEIETTGELDPTAEVRPMHFSYPAASFDMTIGPSEIPFSITIEATTESVRNLFAPGFEEGAIASFALSFDGEQTNTITLFAWLRRQSFGFTLQSGGSVFTQTGGADCVDAGCVGGTFTGTIDSFTLTRLEFLGGAGGPMFALGTDGLGISWTVELHTRYPLTGITETPIVFVPEPTSGALLGLGLVALAVRCRGTKAR